MRTMIQKTGLFSDWRFKLPLLLLLATPAFTGYPLNVLPFELLEDLTLAWPIYGIVVYFVIGGLMGSYFLATAIAVATLITLPVVFSGALLAHLGALLAISPRPAYGSHYVSLTLTMLTVIPLALSLIGALPLQKLEQGLLQSPRGFSLPRKYALITMRVFNHIVYFVVPVLLEVLREEGYFKRRGPDATEHPQSWFKRLGATIELLRHLGLEVICASVQYIPLWSLEISRLPEPLQES